MQTRSKFGIVKPWLDPIFLLTIAEPCIVMQALAFPPWKHTMEQEYDDPIFNKTWSLVSLPVDWLQMGLQDQGESRLFY